MNDMQKVPFDLTMTSLEIAKLTEKEHRNVLADIRRILEDAEIEGANFLAPFKMPSGQVTNVYSLPRRECDLVVSGYSVKYRLAIIDRWHELESQTSTQSFNIPKTLPEALRLAADLAERNEILQSENTAMTAQIESDRPKVEFAMAVRSLDACSQSCVRTVT
jgi:anti-repressor protein